MTAPLRVALAGPLARMGEARLASHFGERAVVSAIADDAPASERTARFAEADALIAMAYDSATPPAPRLALLQLPASGYELVDFAAVPERAAIANVYEHEVGIGEYVMAAMLHWTIDLCGRDRRFRGGDWSETPRLNGTTRGELIGRTVLLLGYGHIGQAVASRALAFGMRVLAVTRRPRPVEPPPHILGAFDDLDRFLPEADFLVVCCPLAPETKGLIGGAAFAAMKPSTVIVNVARGPIVDEDALYAALSERRIGGAIIDAWYNYPTAEEREVRPSRHPFKSLDNVVMTPHISGWTTGQQERRWTTMIDNLERLIDGRPLRNILRQPARAPARP